MGCNMKILLIMKNAHKEPTGLVVAIRLKTLCDQVNFLLKEHREREAFELLRTKAIPLCYVPNGHRLEQYFLTLSENGISRGGDLI